MTSQIATILALALIPLTALGDAYVCQQGSQKVIQSDPCTHQQQTKKAIPSAPAISQEESAALVNQDLERQREWMFRRYRDQAAEMAARQELQRQDAARQAAYQQQQRQIAAQRQAALEEAEQMRYRGSTQAFPGAPAVNPQSSESFTRNGVLRQPAGSSFEYDNKGNAYLRPEGSAFSYGKGGKSCFHYGGFADCR